MGLMVKSEAVGEFGFLLESDSDDDRGCYVGCLFHKIDSNREKFIKQVKPHYASFSSSFLFSHLNYTTPCTPTSFFRKRSEPFLQLLDFGTKTPKLSVGRGRGRPPMASLGGLLGGLFKGTDTGESTRQQYAGTVGLINGLEAEMSALSDLELRERTSVLKERAHQADSLDTLLPASLLLLILDKPISTRF